MIFYVVSFILLLGPLVFVHELGHYLFAKLFNVRVDTFSMGFGPKFFKKKWGETEYCLSAVPLGGYVKLFGQDPTEHVAPELKHRSLNNLEPWKRFLVFVGGPLFNFLFAILVFALILVLGEPNLYPIVSRVVPKSQAWVAGLRSGDLVVSVNKNQIVQFDELNRAIVDSPGRELALRVKRNNEFKEFKVTPRVTSGFSIYGEPIEVGTVDGLFAFARAAVVAVTNPKSPAALAGLKTGDEIITFNKIPVKSFEHLETLFAQKHTEIVLGIAAREFKDWLTETAPQSTTKVDKEIKLPAQSLVTLGIHSSELVVASMVKDSPAEKAGLAAGDRLLSFNDRPLPSFPQLRDWVQEAGEAGETFSLTVEREGKPLTKKIEPVTNEVREPGMPKTKQFMMGVYPLSITADPETYHSRILNPVTLTIEAWSRSIDLSVKTLISIKKLIFRQVSMGTLGGPLLIGKLAGDSMVRGITQFLKVMAMISISLAIFNILPVPVLDGGHIFLLLIEIIRGKPITIRQTEVVQQVGLSLIVLLLVVVLFNDISRVGIPAIRNIFQ